MSEWTLPTLAPPEYLDRKVHTICESDWEYYSSELGLTSYLKPVSTETDSSRRATDILSTENPPPPLSDPPVARSDAWSNLDSVTPSKKRRWIRFKSNFKSCFKSIKCRFTTLGIFLGLLLSLGAIIPITVLWQTSKTASTGSSSSSKGADPFLSASAVITYIDPYFGDQQVIFTTNMTTIALSIVVRVQRTANATYHNTYNSYNSIINSTYTATSTEIIYTFFIQGAQVLLAGNYTCNVQYDLSSNENHTTSIDTYTVQTTNICGVISTVSGNFP